MTQGLGTILSLPGWASLTPLGSTSPSILNSRGCARHPAVGSVLFSAPLDTSCVDSLSYCFLRVKGALRGNNDFTSKVLMREIALFSAWYA